MHFSARFWLCALGVSAACRSAPVVAPTSDSTAAATAAATELTPPALRLPAGSKPRSYSLELTIVPGQPTFSGTATIELDIAQPLTTLWLNGTNLTPATASFRVGERTVAARAQVFAPNHLAVTPSTPLPTGKATLTIAYEGVLSSKDTAGLFQLREGDESYAYTHFEPLDARRAFPCFDEPNFKVPWQATLHVKKEHTALFNTASLGETDEPNGMKAVRFGSTLPLPSYLVAMAVGPFDIVEAGRFGLAQTPVRIVAPKGKGPDTKYAVEVTGPILARLEEYFGIAYPYGKLDSIALPVDTGAMENPGLVTYGHRLLLSRPNEDTPERQRSYARVCAHELAHQWFGDLVTMEWWDDLWLNEAFATWMSNKLIFGWKPQWGDDVLAVQSRSRALATDAMVSARQVRQPIESNGDVRNAFDGITYGKGASVISMFEQWAGPDVFALGVRAYMKEHQHGNATAEQFLGSISKAAGKDVTTPFKTFLDQPGAPRITMTLSCEANQAPSLKLEQRRALPVGSRGDANRVWQVPVCVRYSVKGQVARACTMLSQREGTLALDGAKACPEWVLPNDAMKGHYRARLSGKADLKALVQNASKSLTVAERVGVLGDTNALVGSGDLDVAEALELVSTAAKDDNRFVVGAAMALAGHVEPDAQLVSQALVPKAEAFIRSAFGKKARQLGLAVSARDDEDARLLRVNLVTTVGADGADEVLRRQALQLAKAWVTDHNAIHPDMVSAVMHIAASVGDAGLHRSLMESAAREQDRLYRTRMLAALGSYREPALVRQHLPLTLNNQFDARETLWLLWGASDSAAGRAEAFDFVRAHWEELVSRLPKDSGADLVFIAAGFCDEKRRDEVKAFFDGRSTAYLGGPRNLALALENIELCAAYRARQQPSLVAFLEKWRP